MRDIRLERRIEQTQQNPDQESKLAVVVGRIVNWLRNGSADWAPSQDEILDQLDDLGDSYKIARALEALGQWEINRDYHDGASEALPLLKDVANDALDEDWYNVGLYIYLIAAELARELDSTDELESISAELYSGFEANWIDTSPNTRNEILDSTGYILSGLDTEHLSETQKILDDIASAAHDEHEFRFERSIIDTIIEITDSDDTSLQQDLQSRLITSFERQLDVQNRTGAHEAHLLQEGLSRCSEFLDFPQKNEWKAALRTAHRDQIDDLTEVTQEPSGEELDELNEAIDSIVDRAEEIFRQGHGIQVVYYFLSSSIFLPDATRDFSENQGASIRDIFSHRSLTSEGDSIPERDESQRHSSYGGVVQFRNQLLTNTLARAIERSILKAANLFLYLESIDPLSVHDQAYLTDMIIAHFEGRYAESIHIGVARLEGVIVSMLKDEGVETASLQDGYMKPLSLPRLLSILEDLNVNQDLIEYLRYQYVDLSGQQIRNKIAHGRAPYTWAAWNVSVILIYDILLTVGWLEEDLQYRAE